MLNPTSKAFVDSLQGLTPRGKLLYYFNLFDDKSKHQMALNLSVYFYTLAINNGLLGCYNKISNLISIYLNRTSNKEPGDLNNIRKEVQSNYFKEMNNLKKEIQDVKNKEGEKGLAALYLQIAEVGIRYGEYEEAEDHLRKIRDLKVIPEENYFPMLLKANILSKKIQRSAVAILPNLQKKKMEKPELVEFFVGEGLREIFEGKPNFFAGLLTINPTPEQLAHNEFATPEAIGDFYSILIVANGKRKEVKSDVNFSSGFQQLYVGYKYNQYLQKANEVLNKYTHNPFIQGRIGQIKNTLKKVLLFEVLNVYKVVAIDTVVNILGYKEQDIKNLIAQNRRSSSGYSQYQIDPVEKTIILMEQGNPIIQNMEQINKTLEERHIKLLSQQLIKASKSEFKSSGFGETGGRFRSRDTDLFSGLGGMGMGDMGGMGRMGGMGGMGGMGRMRRERDF